jgi:dienelactone hydrolase
MEQSTVGAVGPETPKCKLLETSGGLRFGLLGDKGASPAPTAFIFAKTIEYSLDEDSSARVGRALMSRGFICVSIDLPCHGIQRRPDEPDELVGWRARIEAGENFVTEMVTRASSVLDHLIENGYTDPDKVVAIGHSRGGFAAGHFAAVDARVRYIAGFAPVTRLVVLPDFAGTAGNKLSESLDLRHLAGKLADRALWVCIGNNDDIVGTDYAIDFTREVTRAAVNQGIPANVELHVITDDDHSIYPHRHDEGAAWILSQVES